MKYLPLLITGTFLATVSKCAATDPPWYDDRIDLLWYKDDAGRLRQVKTEADWAKRVAHIRANMELVMGRLPEKSNLPLDMKSGDTINLRHYTRQHVTFIVEDGDRLPGWLLVPHGASEKDRCPAMICLPGSSVPGKDTPAGLTASADLAYAHELAERGYVCLVLDYPMLHTAEYKTDPYALKYDSATMKGIVNHRRGVDLLQSLPFVDAEAIGVVGHSLGGHNALFLAVFDSRVRAVVSSCGFNVFAKHNKGDVRAWSSKDYMPRIKTVYGDNPTKIPFDFTEVLAALAPRPVFANAPLHDAPDFEVSGVKDCFTAAIPVYRNIFNAEDRLVVRHPDAGHAFPAAERHVAYAFLDRYLRTRDEKTDLSRDLAAHWPSVKEPREIPAKDVPVLGRGNFSFAVWVKVGGTLDRPTGDLLSRYDPKTRRGYLLTLKSSPGVTSNQPNDRHLQFGIDDSRETEWRDCGRPGKALFAFSMATHDGSLYAGTCEPGKDDSGRVHRYAGDNKWIDCGAPDKSNAVTAMAVFNGKLYAGTGKYRVAGSSLKESENLTLGGKVFRYEGGTRWTECGRLPRTEAIGGLVVFRGQLYASSLYKPAGFFRFEDGMTWTALPVPEAVDPKTREKGPRRVVSLTSHDGHIFAGSYDGGHVYQFDGKKWTDCGQLGDNTQTYSFAQYYGNLYVGTWPSGRVYRFEGIGKWADVGRLGDELEVMGMAVHNGRLIAGTLPLGEVYSYEGETTWKKLARLDLTPDVKYRRVWTMAEHDGQLFAGTLPSGKIFVYSAGQQASWGHSLSPGWHHVAAVKSANRLTLYVDGQRVARTPPFDAASCLVDTNHPLRLGTGTNGPLNGTLADVRIYRRAIGNADIQSLSKMVPND
jgi:dienelactone hydrolase/outer membrane protein assembly factor BamB